MLDPTRKLTYRTIASPISQKEKDTGLLAFQQTPQGSAVVINYRRLMPAVRDSSGLLF